MYLVLKRFFFCALLANIQQALQDIVTLQKIILYRFATKSSFIGQGKNTLSIKIVLENLSHYLSYENQQLLPEILDGTNDRRRTSRSFPTSSHLCLPSGARQGDSTLKIQTANQTKVSFVLSK